MGAGADSEAGVSALPGKSSGASSPAVESALVSEFASGSGFTSDFASVSGVEEDSEIRLGTAFELGISSNGGKSELAVSCFGSAAFFSAEAVSVIGFSTVVVVSECSATNP